jgi:hypothetical protein
VRKLCYKACADKKTPTSTSSFSFEPGFGKAADICVRFHHCIDLAFHSDFKNIHGLIRPAPH